MYVYANYADNYIPPSAFYYKYFTQRGSIIVIKGAQTE